MCTKTGTLPTRHSCMNYLHHSQSWEIQRQKDQILFLRTSHKNHPHIHISTHLHIHIHSSPHMRAAGRRREGGPAMN